MPTIRGQSEAFRKLQRGCARAGIAIQRPEDVTAHLAAIDGKLAALEAEVAAARATDRARRETAAQRRDRDHAAIDQRLLHADHFFTTALAGLNTEFKHVQAHPLWFINLDNWLQRHAIRHDVARVQQRRAHAHQTAVRLRHTVDRAFLDATERFTRAATSQLANTRGQRDALRRAANPRQLAGAVGEVEVVDALAALPPEWIVLHDVRLSVRLSPRGRPKRCQIDHVAIGPPGVFVIETKLWSARSAASSSIRSPYAQAKQAATLCRRSLEQKHLNAKVFTVIASRGELPPKPPGNYTHVCAPQALAGYLTTRKLDRAIAPSKARRIADALRPA